MFRLLDKKTSSKTPQHQLQNGRQYMNILDKLPMLQQRDLAFLFLELW
jgi:hypothetical protein